MKKIYLFLVIIFFSASLLWSATIETTITPTVGFVGDRLELEFKIESDEALEIEEPDLKDIPPFMLLSSDRAEEESENGFVYFLKYKITAFETGEFDFPEIDIRIKGKDSIIRVLKSNPLKIEIQTVLEGSEQDIADIKDPVKVRAVNWIFVFVFIGILIVIVLLLFYFSRKKYVFQSFSKPVEPEDVEAIRLLHRLKDDNLTGKGEIKEYYFRLSQIIKKYIGRRYDYNALESTTEETSCRLNRLNVELSVIRDIIELLNECDLVKFAKYKPEEKNFQSIYDMAFSIIERTRQQEEIEEQGGRNVQI